MRLPLFTVILCTLSVLIQSQTCQAGPDARRRPRPATVEDEEPEQPSCDWFDKRNVALQRKYEALPFDDVFHRKLDMKDIIADMDHGQALAAEQDCEQQYNAYFASKRNALHKQVAQFEEYLQMRGDIEASLVTKHRQGSSIGKRTFVWTLDTLQEIEKHIQHRIFISAAGEGVQRHMYAETQSFMNVYDRLFSMMKDAGLQNLATMHYLDILPALPAFLDAIEAMPSLPSNIRYLFLEALVRVIENKIFNVKSHVDDILLIKPALIQLYKTAGRTDGQEFWTRYQQRLNLLPDVMSLSPESDFRRLKQLPDVQRNKGVLVYLHVPKAQYSEKSMSPVWFFTSLDRQQDQTGRERSKSGSSSENK